MAGVKEKSGGPRPGAGRPTKQVSVKPGDEFHVITTAGDGMVVLPSPLWTIESVNRSSITIKSSTGDTIRLLR